MKKRKCSESTFKLNEFTIQRVSMNESVLPWLWSARRSEPRWYKLFHRNELANWRPDWRNAGQDLACLSCAYCWQLSRWSVVDPPLSLIPDLAATPICCSPLHNWKKKCVYGSSLSKISSLISYNVIWLVRSHRLFRLFFYTEWKALACFSIISYAFWFGQCLIAH